MGYLRNIVRRLTGKKPVYRVKAGWEGVTIREWRELDYRVWCDLIRPHGVSILTVVLKRWSGGPVMRARYYPDKRHEHSTVGAQQ